MYIQIGSTIILTDYDLIEHPKEEKDLTDFKISFHEVNKAENILYLNKSGNLKFFKIKNPKQFFKSNLLFKL